MTTTITTNPPLPDRPPARRSPTWRTLLLAVGLALLLFSCFLTWGLVATATGWISGLAADNGEASYTYYDRQHADSFPATNADERHECAARGWLLISIQTAQGVIYDCWKPGRQP